MLRIVAELNIYIMVYSLTKDQADIQLTQ